MPLADIMSGSKVASEQLVVGTDLRQHLVGGNGLCSQVPGLPFVLGAPSRAPEIHEAVGQKEIADMGIPQEKKIYIR